MGQVADRGCSFGNLDLCHSEDSGSGNLVLPSACECRSFASSSTGLSNAMGKACRIDFGRGDIFLKGTGLFSVAIRAVTTSSCPEYRVVRIVQRKGCDYERMMLELEVLRKLDHPNLACVVDLVRDPRFIRLTLGWAPGVDLFSAVSKIFRHRLSEWLVAQLIRQIASALRHMHAVGLAHQDVHPRNILTAVCDAELRVKLVDYGLALKYMKNHPPGCLHCIAPEQAHESMTPRPALFGPACDSWSLGVITFTLLSGHWPIDVEGDNEAHQKRIKTGLWAFVPTAAWTVSDRAKSCVSSLLVAYPAKRLSMNQTLEHCFLKADSLDKNGVKALARCGRITTALGQIAAEWDFRVQVVTSVAHHLPAERFTSFCNHLTRNSGSDKGKGRILISELRKCLVEAGVKLPGRTVNSVVAIGSASKFQWTIEDFEHTVNDHRRNRQASALYAVWASILRDTAVFARRSDMLQILRDGELIFQHVFGSKAKDVEATSMPEQLTFQNFLDKLLEASSFNVGIFDWRRDFGDLHLRLPVLRKS